MTIRLLTALTDSGPVLILAGIAAAGSFTHIRDTAAQHGQGGWMSWAIAVCVDLTCVMAARERHRDERTRRPTRPLSWPTVVLTGGVVLSLAANLAQAEPTYWGWITAATPAAAFLVAVSMLERRATATARTRPEPAAAAMRVPPSFGRPDHRPQEPAEVPSRPGEPSSSPGAVPPSPPLSVVPDQPPPEAASVPDSGPAPGPHGPLLDFARRVASEHHTRHGRPITRDALRARLGISNQLASDLLRHLRTETT